MSNSHPPLSIYISPHLNPWNLRMLPFLAKKKLREGVCSYDCVKELAMRTFSWIIWVDSKCYCSYGREAKGDLKDRRGDSNMVTIQLAT